MKMEREKIIERLKEALEKGWAVTIVVRTMEHETQEIPLEVTGVQRDASGEWFNTWEMANERETGREVVRRTFKGTDRRGNRTEIGDVYLVENIEDVRRRIRVGDN